MEDGKAVGSIVIPAEASPSMKYGAQQIQDVIKTMSGATLPMDGSGATHIVLAVDPTLGNEGFAIDCDGRTITIKGGAPRGVIYGCFAFLEENLGCRWYTARLTVIPEHRTVSIPVRSVREVPAFEYREPFFTEAFDGHWAVANGVNGNFANLTPEMGGKVSYGKFVHTAAQLVPPATYFATHPEYYALRDGKRSPDQLEMTNPDVVKIATATVEDWIKADPNATIFSVSQNDNWAESQSPETQTIDREEGAPSGLNLRFVNQIAAEVAKTHPNVLIDTLAYQWTEKPPKLTKPLPNVRIRLAPIGADFAHGLADSPMNAQPYANLKAWAEITHQLYIWHYCTDFANYLQPLPDLDEIPADLKLFEANGVVGVFYEGDSAPGGGGDMAELKSYLMAKLMWNPDQPARPIIEEFVKADYRMAAPFILQWLDLVQSAARHGVTATIYDQPNAPYFTDEMLAKGNELFDQAEQAAGTGPAAEEVARARLGLEYVELRRAKKGSPEFQALAKTVADKIHRFGITQTSEGGASSTFLKSIGQS